VQLWPFVHIFWYCAVGEALKYLIHSPTGMPSDHWFVVVDQFVVPPLVVVHAVVVLLVVVLDVVALVVLELVHPYACPQIVVNAGIYGLSGLYHTVFQSLSMIKYVEFALLCPYGGYNKFVIDKTFSPGTS
jgi:hypothetical protein